MASVLELLSCRKFCVIHAFISSRQVVMVDEGDGEGDGGVLCRVVCHQHSSGKIIHAC